MAKFDMNAGRRHKSDSSQTEQQVELREKLKQRNRNIDQTVNTDEAGSDEQQPQQPTGMAAEKACFVTIAIPESLKRIIDIKAKYESKELPKESRTIKFVGRRWFLRGLLAEGLITQEQFDEASALASEYGWEKDKVAAKRNRK